MAVIYCRSTDGSDSDDGSTWALAKATLAAALTAAGVGGTVWVSQSHNESGGAAMTLASPGTAASPVTVLCGNDAAAPPTALASTAVVATTGGAYGMTFSGFAYYYGITFSPGAGQATANSIVLGAGNYSTATIFDTCVLELATSGATSNVQMAGSRDLGLWLINTNFKPHATGQSILVKGRFYWIGGTLDVTSAIPTKVFNTLGGNSGSAYVQGVNFSGCTGAVIAAGAIDGAVSVRYNLKNCRLHASMTALTAQAITGQGADQVFLDNCSSGDTNYHISHSKYEGSIVDETTIVRTSGASDGTTPFSWKMVSLAGANFYWPLESPPIAVWNESTGSEMTLTVEIVHDSATALQDDEVWVEVEYLGTSGYTTSSRATDRAATYIATPADQAASTVDWTTTGITNVNKQKLVATFTPAEKGPIVAKVMLGKASYTVYVCPKVVVA
jgi:hypothetical protein